MAIFAIIALPGAKIETLGAAVTRQHPDAFPMDGQRGWFVSAQTSAQNLSEALGITSGENGSAYVLEVTSYFGRANPNTWTWLKEKFEAARNV